MMIKKQSEDFEDPAIGLDETPEMILMGRKAASATTELINESMVRRVKEKGTANPFKSILLPGECIFQMLPKGEQYVPSHWFTFVVRIEHHDSDDHEVFPYGHYEWISQHCSAGALSAHDQEETEKIAEIFAGIFGNAALRLIAYYGISQEEQMKQQHDGRERAMMVAAKELNPITEVDNSIKHFLDDIDVAEVMMNICDTMEKGSWFDRVIKRLLRQTFRNHVRDVRNEEIRAHKAENLNLGRFADTVDFLAEWLLHQIDEYRLHPESAMLDVQPSVIKHENYDIQNANGLLLGRLQDIRKTFADKLKTDEDVPQDVQKAIAAMVEEDTVNRIEEAIRTQGHKAGDDETDA